MNKRQAKMPNTFILSSVWAPVKLLIYILRNNSEFIQNDRVYRSTSIYPAKCTDPIHWGKYKNKMIIWQAPNKKLTFADICPLRSYPPPPPLRVTRYENSTPSFRIWNQWETFFSPCQTSQENKSALFSCNVIP